MDQKKFVTPSASELIKFVSNIKCIIPECGKKLSTTSALRFHLIYGHSLKGDDPRIKSNCPLLDQNVNYHCPEEKCKHNKSIGRSFKTLRETKQHYINNHMEKTFPCWRCQMLFATEKKRSYHLRDCGVRFVCSCQIAYSGRQGLMHHISRSKHDIPTHFAYLWKKKHKVKSIKKGAPLILPKGLKCATLEFKTKTVNSILPLTTTLCSFNKTHKILPKSNTVILTPPSKTVVVQPVPILKSIKQANGTTNTKICPKKLMPKSASLQRFQSTNLGTAETSVQTDYSSNNDAFTISTQTEKNDEVLDELMRELQQGSGGQDMSSQTEFLENAFNWGSPLNIVRPLQNIQSMSTAPTNFSTLENRDFGMQTDTFNDLEELLMSTSTQTTGNNDYTAVNHVSNFQSSSSMTQTDDLQNLFNLMTDDQPQKADQPVPPMEKNQNNNSSIPLFIPSYSNSMEMQTQTNDLGIPVQTQTNYTHNMVAPIHADVGNSTSFLDFLNNNATQTDIFPFTNSTSSQTQASDNFLADFLNIETQTDSSYFSSFDLHSGN